jgi:hypothetical protein
VLAFGRFMPDEDSEAPPVEAAPAEAAPADAAPAEAAPAEAAPAEAAPATGETKSTKRKKKRKKQSEEPEKRKKQSEEPAAPTAEPLNAEGRERPLFVLAFPSHPELDKLVRAFELGNYAYVRKHAPELAEQAKEPSVRDAALELARRIEPDPLIKTLLGLSVALLFALTIWAYQTHGP